MTMNDSEQRERLTIEKSFHDSLTDIIESEQLCIYENFESIIAQENASILKWFNNLKNKKILDLGCGLGEASLFFNSLDAEVYSQDISLQQLIKLKKNAIDYNAPISLNLSDASALPFKNSTFDFVYGNGVLHHIDIPTATNEIKRILKPNGKAAFIDPLPYNPAIKIYRNMARKFRSSTEKPLSKAQIKWICKQFSNSQHEVFWLTSLIVFFYMYFIEKVHPSEDRYWKRLYRNEKKYSTFLKPFICIDKYLKKIPGLSWLAWNVVILVKK